MNKIILCEGETDAILLSYYLGKVAGWKFCKKPPANIAGITLLVLKKSTKRSFVMRIAHIKHG